MSHVSHPNTPHNTSGKIALATKSKPLTFASMTVPHSPSMNASIASYMACKPTSGGRTTSLVTCCGSC